MDEVWVPEACTLPTVERPGRVAAFDGLLAEGLRRQERVGPTVLRWLLDPAVEGRARELAAREQDCCAFFDFAFAPSEDGLVVEVRVPDAYAPVLDGLAR
jgi:hypothetical protein